MYFCYMLLCVAVYAYIGTTRRLFASAASVESSTSYDCVQKSATPVSCIEQTNPHILLPHPEDCQLFYHCLGPDLPPVCRKCPYDQHFDPVKLVCTLSSEAGCELLIDTTLNNTTISRQYDYHNKGTEVFQSKHELSSVNDDISNRHVLRRSQRKTNIVRKGLEISDNEYMSGNSASDYDDPLDIMFSDLLHSDDEVKKDRGENYDYQNVVREDIPLDPDPNAKDQNNNDLNRVSEGTAAVTEETTEITVSDDESDDDSFGTEYYDEGEEFTKDPFLMGSAKGHGAGAYFIKVYHSNSKYDVVRSKPSLPNKTNSLPTTGGVRVYHLDFGCFLHFYNSSRNTVPLKRYFVPFFSDGDVCSEPPWYGPQVCDDFCSHLLPCYEIGYILTYEYSGYGYPLPGIQQLSRFVPIFYIKKTKRKSIPVNLVDSKAEWLFNYSNKRVYSPGKGPKFAPVIVRDLTLEEGIKGKKRRYTIIKNVSYDVYGPIKQYVNMNDVVMITELQYYILFYSGDPGALVRTIRKVQYWRRRFTDTKNSIIFLIKKAKFGFKMVARELLDELKWFKWAR